jgi:allantoinase
VDEFPEVSRADLEIALSVLARLKLPLLVHAELPGPIESAAVPSGPLVRYNDYRASRPAEAEHQAVSMMIDLLECGRASGAGDVATTPHVHIVHVSSAGTVPLMRAARAARLPISAETCPHYLSFEAAEIRDGATEFKCAPPIRSADHRARLWDALREREIEMIVTDHSPSPPELKRYGSGDFRAAWGGIASLQLSLPAVWTAGQPYGIRVEDLADWMCARPARLAGLEHRKGMIAEGRDGDLVIWDPDASFVVNPSTLYHRHSLTPYAGRTLLGAVHATFLRGRRIYDRGAFAPRPAGELVAKSSATDS